MWPRTVELMLACWLAISPFIFRYPAEASRLWWHDFAVATLIGVLAFASFARRWRRTHLLELLIAIWLIAYGWITAEGIHDAPRQNWMCLGLLLLMVAIIPTDCDQPPYAWQEWNRQRGLKGDRPQDAYVRKSTT